jgi:hypothetical protein
LRAVARRTDANLSFLEKNAMFNPAHPYEPLTSENAALVLVDHQVGLMSGVRDYSIAELKHNVVGLAKAPKDRRCTRRRMTSRRIVELFLSMIFKVRI